MATGGLHVHTSDEIFDFTCSPCAEQNKNREAVRYCVECQDYYCESCTDMHRMFPAMRGHKLLNKADFNSSSHQPSLPPVPTERCNNHKTKLIDMYCRDHDEVCCTSCVAENHRSCDSVTSVTDVIKKSGASKETDVLIQELNILINVCLEIKTTKESDMSEIDLAKETALDEMKKQRKELDTLLDELENATKKKIENEHKKLSGEFAEVKQKITEYESRLQKRVSALQSSGSNEAQRFVSEKLGHKDLVEISEVTNTVLRENKTSLELHGDPKLVQVFSEKESMGEVKRYVKSCTIPVQSLYQIERTRGQNVNIPSDKGACDIWSCCFDEKGNLLLTDWANNTLKRVNLQTESVTDHCVMPSHPIAVCCVNKEEASVSVSNRSIQFVSIRDQMKITRQVKLDHQCSGISCNEGSMYITDEGKTLYIYNVSGKLINVVKHDNKGNDIFYSNRLVTFDRYSGKVYVCDISNGLVSFNKEGSYISSFTDKILSIPLGACSDGGGNIFVCGWSSRNVIQIGRDGKILGEVVGKSYRLGSIWSVCFDERQKRLVVTVDRSNMIHIFDLA